ncbi:secreted protein [Melampsora americana]|nr:secreted protein [Melampsora americana]
MLSFKSHKFVIIFIGICITQFASNLCQTQCQMGNRPHTNGITTICGSSDSKAWLCYITNCNNNGHRWVLMKGCLHNGDPKSPRSNQQCVFYNFDAKTNQYDCKNSGSQSYKCPYTPSNVPFVTCSGCQYQGKFV